MKTILGAAVVALLSATSANAQGTPPARAEIAQWEKPQAPFRIIGNIYYVGTAGLAAFLIVSREGDVLIDGTLEQTAPQIERNIEALGFKLSDVKLILNSHAHFDHAAGIARLKKDTGAELAASAGDTPILERGYITYGPTAGMRFPSVKVDRVVRDGDTVGFGDAMLTAHLTPGHTPGCTSWTTTVRDAGVRHTAIFYCSTTVAGNPLVNNTVYPNIVADYRASFAKLKTIKADVFLGPHVEFFDMRGKLAARKPGAPNPFVDAGELARFVATSEADFDKALAQQQAAQHR